MRVCVCVCARRRRQGPHPGVVADVQLVCPADTRVGRGRRLQPVPTKVVASEEGVPVHTLPRGTYVVRRRVDGWWYVTLVLSQSLIETVAP